MRSMSAECDAMDNSGVGIFFDGVTSARHEVSVELGPRQIVMRSKSVGDSLARWPYGELEHLAAPEGMLRLGRIDNPVLARLEIRDPDLAHAIDEHAVTVDRSGATERRGRAKVVAWSFAAVVGLFVAAVFGVPAVADRVAPLVPLGFERWLGAAVDTQARAMLDTRKVGQAFECGEAESERAGRAALDALLRRLEAAAALPLPLRAVVVRRNEANAVALPGGRIYLFDGLIARAETADELAAVIAHEIGHVARRDGMRSILQAAGLSFLFGVLLGDFVGGGAVIVAAKTLLQSSYSREVEADADRFAVALMTKVGGDARALARILDRIAGANHPAMTILLDHPETRERVAAINAAPQGSPQRLIEPAEWAALKRICGGR